MLTLRLYTQADWPVLVRYQYPTITETEAKQLIRNYNLGYYDNKKFQMLAIEYDGTLIGYTSLLEQAPGIASEGVEIYPPYRRQGFAYSALRQLLEQATAYHTITAQIRKSNTASLALHKKLGFQITEEFINQRGHEVYSLTLYLEIATSLRSSQ